MTGVLIMLNKILCGGVVALGAALAYTIRQYDKNISDYKTGCGDWVQRHLL